MGYGRRVTASSSSSEILAVLHQVVTAVGDSLVGLDDWGLAGTATDGQYRSDLIADRAVLAVIDRAGMGAFCRRSRVGITRSVRSCVVVDPVDGSTNASRGLPWWATSLCALDADGPLAAVVVNQATRTCFEARRGGGARCDGRPITPTGCQSMRHGHRGPVGLPEALVGLEPVPGPGRGGAGHVCGGGRAGRCLHRLCEAIAGAVGLLWAASSSAPKQAPWSKRRSAGTWSCASTDPGGHRWLPRHRNCSLRRWQLGLDWKKRRSDAKQEGSPKATAAFGRDLLALRASVSANGRRCSWSFRRQP